MAGGFMRSYRKRDEQRLIAAVRLSISSPLEIQVWKLYLHLAQ